MAGPDAYILKLPRSPRGRRFAFEEDAPPSVWLCAEWLLHVNTVALLVLSLISVVGCIRLLELDSWCPAGDCASRASSCTRRSK